MYTFVLILVCTYVLHLICMLVGLQHLRLFYAVHTPLFVFFIDFASLANQMQTYIRDNYIVFAAKAVIALPIHILVLSNIHILIHFTILHFLCICSLCTLSPAGVRLPVSPA